MFQLSGFYGNHNPFCYEYVAIARTDVSCFIIDRAQLH